MVGWVSHSTCLLMNSISPCATARLLPIALFAAATLLPLSVSAVTWDGGAGDGKFSSANNWDGDVVPSGAIAEIHNGDTVTIDSNIEPSAIYLAGGSVLNQTAGEVTLTAQARIGNGKVDSVLSTWNISGGKVSGTQLRIGQADGGDAGKGILNISGSAEGATLVSLSGNLWLANGNNGYGELNLSGYGKMTVANEINVGRFGTNASAKLTLADNSQLSASSLVAGYNGTVATVILSGGQLTLSNTFNYAGAGTGSSLTMTGGTITTTKFEGRLDRNFTVSGGVLKVASGSTINFLQNVTMTLAGNGVTIDTNGSNVAEATGGYTALITGTGGLTKTGSGTLTLNKNHDYSGATKVEEGVLLVAGTISSADIRVASGAELQLKYAGSVDTSAVLRLVSGASLFLDFENAEMVTFNHLFVDGQALAAGTYSVDDAQFWMDLGVTVQGTAGSTIEVIAVPEPSTYAFFGAAGLAGLLVLRRRRKA